MVTKNKKKVVIFAQENLCRNTGGSITCTAVLSNLLSDNGYDVKCIYYSSASTEGTLDLLNDEVELINLYDKKDKMSFCASSNKFVEKYKPDLIIFFFPHLYAQAALDEKLKNIPRILMFHSRPDWYFAADAYMEYKLKRLYENTISVILFDSYHSLLPKFIQDASVITIPNAVSQYGGDRTNEVEHKKIVFFSRIDPYKGIDFLLTAFSLVINKYPDWQLDLYGDIEPVEYKQKLQRIIKKLKLENNVFFKGIVNNTTDTLKKYDFAVFPSYFEGFPIGLLEMQSAGLPCVGLEGCSGVNELIIDKYNGFLVPKSSREFARKIEKLIKDPDMRKRFSANAYKEARKYNFDIVSQKWLNVVQDIVDNKHNSTKYVKSVKRLFDIPEIMKMNPLKKKRKWYQYIFAITKSNRRLHINITIFGLNVTIKRRIVNV